MKLKIISIHATVVPVPAIMLILQHLCLPVSGKPIYMNECNNIDDQKLLQHETDCTKYYLCVGGKRVIGQCQEGAFNHLKQMCDSNTICKNYEHQLHHDNYFVKTIQVKKANSEKQSQEDKQIKKTTKKCKPKTTSPIPTTVNPTTVCPQSQCQDSTIYLPFLADDRQFIRCVKGKELLGTCPNGLVFDPKLNVCNLEEYVHKT